MPEKIKTVRICILVNAWLYLVGGIISTLLLLLFALGIGSSGAEGANIGAGIFSVLAVFIGVYLYGIAVACFVVAKAIREKKSWSKIAAIVIGVLQIFNFPVGTILGVLIMIGMLDKSADEWFA